MMMWWQWWWSQDDQFVPDSRLLGVTGSEESPGQAEVAGQEEDGLPHHGQVEADQGEAGQEVERQPEPAQHRGPAVLGDHLAPQTRHGGEVATWT